MRDNTDYRLLYLPDFENIRLKPCPVCGSNGALYGVWPHVDEFVICCTHGAPIGNQSPDFVPGCPMYLPKREFHQESVECAIDFWNAYYDGIVELRRSNASK